MSEHTLNIIENERLVDMVIIANHTTAMKLIKQLAVPTSIEVTD